MRASMRIVQTAALIRGGTAQAMGPAHVDFVGARRQHALIASPPDRPPARSFSKAALGVAQGRQWVDYGQPIPGTERRLDDAKQPFTASMTAVRHSAVARIVTV